MSNNYVKELLEKEVVRNILVRMGIDNTTVKIKEDNQLEYTIVKSYTDSRELYIEDGMYITSYDNKEWKCSIIHTGFILESKTIHDESELNSYIKERCSPFIIKEMLYTDIDSLEEDAIYNMHMERQEVDIMLNELGIVYYPDIIDLEEDWIEYDIYDSDNQWLLRITTNDNKPYECTCELIDGGWIIKEDTFNVQERLRSYLFTYCEELISEEHFID